MQADKMAEKSAYLLSKVGGQAEAERLRKQGELVLERELASLLRALPQGGTLVDVGCGMGLLADAVARARPDAQVLGVDADAMAVEEAKRLFAGVPNLRFELRGLPAEGPLTQPADVLALRLVLMHLPQPVQALGSLKAWGRPGAELHLIEGDDRGIRLDPAWDALPELLDILEAVQVQRGGSRRRGRELEGLLRTAGWEPKGSARSLPDPARAAKALGEVFLPVVDFHLVDAEARGLLAPGQAQAWSSRARTACGDALQAAELPLYHAWATLR